MHAICYSNVFKRVRNFYLEFKLVFFYESFMSENSHEAIVLNAFVLYIYIFL